MDGGATTATLHSPALQRYRRWVRSISPDLAAVADVACLEEPTPDFIARLAAARAADVPRLICGFLPDEVEWPVVGWNEDMAFFVARMEFRPLRFSAPAAIANSSVGPYVVVTDLPFGTVSGAESVTVAAACAQAGGRELITIDVLTADDDEIAAAVAIASVVFNDTADWSVGFAVDELTARLGRHCVRLRPAAYSPLRYAFLNRALPRTAPEGVPRLRPLLAGVIGRTACLPTAVATDVFDPAVAPEFWGRLVRSKTFALFTEGGVWAHAANTGSHDVRRWLNRATSWALLAAAGQDAAFSRETWELAVRTVTTWLCEEQGVHLRGKVRNCALMRWVRLFPEWLDRYREVAGETDESRKVVALWVGGGLDWLRCDAPVGPLLTHARWAIDTAEGEHHPWALLRAWRDDWSAVPAAAEGWPPLSALWREACLEAALIHLRGENSSLSSPAAFSALPEVWRASLGCVAAVVRCVAATRAGRREIARVAQREVLREIGLPALGGVTRLVRATFAESAGLEAWVRTLARAPKLATGEIALLWRWHMRRADDLWRLHPAANIRGELHAVLRWLDWRSQERNRSPDVLLHAALLALDQRSTDAIQVVARAAAGGARLGALPGVVALALWCRGAKEAARDLLQAHPEHAADAAWPLFLRAVAWQLIGDLSPATRVLTRLNALAPAFLTGSATDTRWSWAAVVFKHGGCGDIAARMERLATEAGNATPLLWSDVAPGGTTLAPGWEQLPGS